MRKEALAEQSRVNTQIAGTVVFDNSYIASHNVQPVAGDKRTEAQRAKDESDVFEGISAITSGLKNKELLTKVEAKGGVEKASKELMGDVSSITSALHNRGVLTEVKGVTQQTVSAEAKRSQDIADLEALDSVIGNYTNRATAGNAENAEGGESGLNN